MTPTSTRVNKKPFACPFQNRQFQNLDETVSEFLLPIISEVKIVSVYQRHSIFHIYVPNPVYQNLIYRIWKIYGMPLIDSFKIKSKIRQIFTPAPAEFLHFYWGRPMNM